MSLLGASLLGHLLEGKGTIGIGEGTFRADKGTIRASEDAIRSGQDFHPLSNFEIQCYYQKEPKFNGVYSRNNLPKIKDGTWVIYLDESESIRPHWVALYMNGNSIVIYVDSFEVQKKLKNS